MNESYLRIIPRDFFNESKLLCCLGKLSVQIHDRLTNGLDLEQEFDNEPFQVEQSMDDGSLYVVNYSVYLNKEEVLLYTPYNSRRKYPLRGEYKGEIYEVLDEDGKLNTTFGL